MVGMMRGAPSTRIGRERRESVVALVVRHLLSCGPPPRSRGDSRMGRSQTLGAEGEARAARWLEAQGYALLARNARADGVEIDLVVARGDTIAFVEVKARRSRAHGAPEEAVDARK